MGWSTGLRLAEELWDQIEKHVTDKPAVAEAIRDTFAQYDCDEIDEADFVQRYVEGE